MALLQSFCNRTLSAHNAIERCLGRLKQYRHITMHDVSKNAHFLAFLCLAASLTWAPEWMSIQPRERRG